MSQRSTEELAALVARKLACLGTLRQLGGVQRQLITDGRTAELLDLLATKQVQLKLLGEVEEALAPYRDEDPERRVWRDAKARDQCARMAAACAQILAQLVSDEQADEGALSEARDRIAEQLDTSSRAAQARTAYADQRRPLEGQLDLSSGM